MESQIFDFVSSTFGVSFATALALLVLAFYLTHVVTKKVTEIRMKNDSLDSSVVKIEAHIDDIRKDISYLKGVMEADYLKKSGRANMMFSQKHSPRSLNANGKYLFGLVGGEKFLEDNKDVFFSQIDQMNPKTAYDVEQAASLVCARNTSNPMFDGIKSFVYNSPSIELDKDGEKVSYDITLNDVCFVLSIPLRDMYLSAHTDIKS